MAVTLQTQCVMINTAPKAHDLTKAWKRNVFQMYDGNLNRVCDLVIMSAMITSGGDL